METIEQINNDFNVKKTKKKGLIIAGIIVAVVIIALALVYFLVFAKPQFIFNGAIDKLFDFEPKQHDSIRLETKIAVSVEAEDPSIQEQLAEIEKYTLKFGTQMDVEQKREIVDVGLEYDNEAVVDAKVYYNDGDMYAYLEGLFDKYIKMDMEDEQKEELKAIFDTASSEENIKNTEKAMKIVKDELKSQIKEYGEFEKEGTTIEVGDKKIKVKKSTLTLSQKKLYNVISKMCLNLAKNEEFLDCFEESIKDQLKEIAEKIESAETNSKNKVKISIYTKGILNKLVAVDGEIYSEEDAQTIKMLVVKEDEGLYTYKISVKSTDATMDAIKGKVEIKKDKDSDDETSGKTMITAEIAETGKAKLVIDYLVEYNKGIDKIDTSNNINMTEMTEEDMQEIMEKLMERPLIGDLITNSLGTDTTTQSLTTSQNEVKNESYGYSTTYSVPTGFEYENDYSYDYSKYYTLEDNDSSIEANVLLGWYTDEEYKEEIDWNYNYCKNYYKNTVLGELKTIKVEDKEFKYQIISYESNSEYYSQEYQEAYVWYNLNDEYVFAIELESSNKEITEDIIKGFLNISVKEI